MSRIKRRRPRIHDIADAMHYWAVFDDCAAHFTAINMPQVSKHLKAACKEINRIWEEGDFDDGTKTAR